MTRSDNAFRVWGGALNGVDTYVDLTVDSVGYDGTVYAVDPNDNVHIFEPGRLEDLHEKDQLVFESDIPAPNHDIWKQMKEIKKMREKNDFIDSVDSRLKEAGRMMFKAAILYGK